MVVTVVRWTGREVKALREALRMSGRDFANYTGLSTSAIADMEAKGDHAQLRHATQQVLDHALAKASDEATQRFCAILGDMVLQSSEASTSDVASEAAGDGTDSSVPATLVLSSLKEDAYQSQSRTQTIIAEPSDELHSDQRRADVRAPTAWSSTDSIDAATERMPEETWGVETNRRRAATLIATLVAAVSSPVGSVAGLFMDRRPRPGSDRRLLAAHVEIGDLLASLYRTVDPRAVLPMATAYADDLLDQFADTDSAEFACLLELLTLGALELAPADEGAGEAEEGFVDVVADFPADA